MVRAYKTERGFHAAFAKYNAQGRIIHWYGTDHHWVIVLKKKGV